MENTFFAINSCFSTEIYDENHLYEKLENIYSFVDNYLDISSKIYLINDGPISIPINHNKIKVISSKKRLGRDVEPVNKVVTCFNYFIESDCDTIIWLLDDFYTFPSFIQKLKESKHLGLYYKGLIPYININTSTNSITYDNNNNCCQ